VFLRIPQGHSEPSVLVDVFVMRVTDSAITETACSSPVSAPSGSHSRRNKLGLDALTPATVS